MLHRPRRPIGDVRTTGATGTVGETLIVVNIHHHERLEHRLHDGLDLGGATGPYIKRESHGKRSHAHGAKRIPHLAPAYARSSITDRDALIHALEDLGVV